MMEGGLMKFLAKGATDKIIEDADDKREALLKTFQVRERFFVPIQLLPIRQRFSIGILRHHGCPEGEL
jgi:hypothetical protein